MANNQKMEIACRLLRRNGYDVKSYKNDGNEFFAIIGEDFPGKTKSAGAARNIICDFQEKHQHYFQLFLPRKLNSSLTHSNPVENFKNDIIATRKNKVKPSPREIFAASEILERCIHIFEFTGNNDKDVDSFIGIAYTPVIKRVLPPCNATMLVMVVDASTNLPSFARIVPRSDGDTVIPFPAPVFNTDHKNCYDNRFRNTYIEMRMFSPPGQQTDKKDLFRRLSIELYGTDQYRKVVKDFVCNFQEEDDNLDVFARFIAGFAEDMSLEDRRKHVKDHVDKVRLHTQLPAQGEIFAAASVFNVFIYIDKNCADFWEMYCPLGETYSTTFDSPIALKRQTDDCYIPYVTDMTSCACKQRKVTVKGNIVVVKEDIYRTLAKKPCCKPESRHGCHRHYKHIGGSKIEHEERIPYDMPPSDIQLVLHKLQSEERTLDQIDQHDSLYGSLAKEVFGREDFEHRHLRGLLSEGQRDVEAQIQSVADWLDIPIYVYRSVVTKSHRYLWKCYKPKVQQNSDRKEGCRQYVTLFQGISSNEFHRIVPRQGCNCQLLPPMSILRNSHDPRFNASLVAISKGERHNAMVTFLTEDPDPSLFQSEEREFPPCAPYSEMRNILARTDMTSRTIDAILDSSFSMYRCISKEIFGTEDHFYFILKEVCSEILENPKTYEMFVNIESHPDKFQFRNIFKNAEEIRASKVNDLLTELAQSIEDGLAEDDTQLLVLCTHFQTPILVLAVDEDGYSSWTEYTQMRTKRKPAGISERKHFSKCAAGTFHVTLYRSSAGHYHRIVPDTEVCNCSLPRPEFPGRQMERYQNMPSNEKALLLSARKVENAITKVKMSLDEWLICNRSMQGLTDKIVLELESRRRGVNIATLVGSGVGISGTMFAVGAFLFPFTGGASTVLMVIGGVVGGIGGAAAAGAGIAEFVMNKDTVLKLDRYQNGIKIRSDRLRSSLDELQEAVQVLDQRAGQYQLTHNIEAFDVAALRAIPNVLRMIKGFAIIPLGVLRLSIRGAAIAGAVLGPLAGIVDVGFVAWSAYNLFHGSKTDISENLRRIAAMLRSSRIQMHAWAFGNDVPLMYR